MHDVEGIAFPAQELFDAYHALRAQIDALCERPPWGITGVSALLCDETHWYFELTKPKHWRQRADGTTEVGLGGIGGSIEQGETALACLRREAQEELGVGLEVDSAPVTHFVYEQRLVASLSLEPRAYPRPALFTISENLYRQGDLAFPTLAIVTFRTRMAGEPRLRDLYGLAAMPHEAVSALLRSEEIPLNAFRSWPGVRMMTQEPLPSATVLVPTWTGRSLQRLVQAGVWR